MTKGHEFNIGMNNSSALVAPTRSEIRIEFPTIHIPLPTKKQILEQTIKFAKRIVHSVSLLSAFMLSAMSFLEIYIPVFTILTVVICLVFCNASLYLIYKEVQEE